MQATRRIVYVAVIAGLTLIAARGSARAAEDEGREVFLRYCSSCHGAGGKGDGPVAETLKVKPADLTQISKRHGGKFPGTRVMQIIDGTETIRAHGAGEMPVWGEVFKEGGPAGIEPRAKAAGRVSILTNYVESIQQP